MSRTKMPAMQWYVGDWRKDPGVQALDFESRGIWFEILMLMHESENRGKLTLNGKAIPDEALANLLGIDQAKLQQTLSKLLSYGVASREQDTEIIYCRRMVKDEEFRATRIRAGHIGGKQSASKRQANAKQNPTPSSSSSSSSSTSVRESKQKNGFEKLTERDREILEDLERIHGKPEVDRATAWMLRHGKRAAYVAKCFEDHPGKRVWDRVNGSAPTTPEPEIPMTKVERKAAWIKAETERRAAAAGMTVDDYVAMVRAEGEAEERRIAERKAAKPAAEHEPPAAVK